MAKVRSTVSKSLQDTVREHKHIEKVYFDMQGNHYFNAHEHKPTIKNDGTGGLYARIHRRDMVDENGRKVQLATPILATKIVEECDREDILNADAQSDFVLSQAMLNTLPAEARQEIQKLMSGSGKELSNKGKGKLQ